jgi:predicted ribosomally synthesized peptide with nif11-like leader
MNENVRAFLQKLADDKALQAQFEEIKDPDKAYELATSVQGGFSKDEFIAAMKEIKAQMSRDLSDDDLEKIAGGGCDNSETTTTTTTTTTTAEIAAMAGL